MSTGTRQDDGSHPPLVAVVADLRSFDDYRWHAVPAQYLDALNTISGATPLIVPALGPGSQPERILEHVSGLLLTGSRSNVHPARYGATPSPAHEPYDPARDATSLPLIRATLEAGLPLFAICRGMQELNVALGGTIAPEIHALPGRIDHRAPDSPDQDSRFAIRQRIQVVPGGRLAGIVGSGDIMVNSVHRQAIDRPARDLLIEASAEDGTIEAVSVADAPAFALGVQWHPEYWAASDEISRRLFAAFGAALRASARKIREAAE